MMMKNKMKVFSGILALLAICPGYAAAGVGSDTGTEVLDYIERQKQAERENSLDTELVELHREAAAHQEREAVGNKLPPVTFEGDDIVYDQKTGAVYAKGKVKITRIESRLLADAIKGNTKTADVYIDDKAHMLQVEQPRLVLDGYKTSYNYVKKTGTMENVKGKLDQKYIKGEKLEFLPEHMVIYNGTMTKCSAKVPDYHISADKIEVWPDDHMVMYNVKFWVKNKVVAKKKRHETEIGTNKKDKAFPRIGYHSDDGVYVKQNFEYPVQKNVNAYVDLNYYTKHDFKNVYGVNWNNGYNHFDLQYGSFEDDDDVWIKKEPTLTYRYGSRKIGSSPFSYYLGTEIGKWKDDSKSSWHKEYYVGLSRDPIDFGKTLHLYTGMEYSITRESYDDSEVKGLSYHATLLKEVNDRLAVFTSYRYSQTTDDKSLFDYGSDDYARKLEAGFSYRINERDRIVIGQSYDLENNVTKDVDYYWYHDMHCVQMILRYRDKRDDFQIHFEVAPW